MGMERNTAHQYTLNRGKNPFEKNSKKTLHSTWAFLLKSLDIFSLEKLGPEMLITSYLAVFIVSVEGNANEYFHNNCYK